MGSSGSLRAERCSVRRQLVAGALALAVGMLSRSSPADASESGLENVEIRYVVHGGVVGCPTHDEFRAAVWKRLNAKALHPKGAVVVTTELSPDREGLRARVAISTDGVGNDSGAVQELVGGKGECATLSAAVALTVALAIEQSIEERALEERAPETAKPQREPSATPTSRPRALAPSAAPRSRPLADEPKAAPTIVHLRTHVGAFTGYEIVPQWSPGASFGASVRYTRWSAGLETVFWLWSTLSALEDPGLAANARLIALRGALCGHADPFFACATATVGDYRVAGSGKVVSESDHVLWPAVGGRGGMELAISRTVSVLLRADLQVPLVRASLDLDGRPRWRAPPIGLELGPTCQVTIW